MSDYITININGLSYKVRQASQRELREQIADIEPCERLDGVCDYGERTIYICSSLSRIQKASTLCHEMLHAQLDTRSHESIVRDIRTKIGEEKFVTGLEPIVWDIVKHFPTKYG